MISFNIYCNDNDDDEIIQTNNNLYEDTNNNINECVICLEPVINFSEISKFGCNHSKYMHDNCIKNLRKCPLCRERSIIIERNTNHNSLNLNNQGILCFLCGCFFIILFLLSMYPLMYLNFSNSKIGNFTSSNFTSIDIIFDY